MNALQERNEQVQREHHGALRNHQSAAFNQFGQAALADGNDCRKCGADLPLKTEGYPHLGGWDVPGFGRYWLYITCPGCAYQWALWKLGLPRDWQPPTG